eukprot:2308506-Pyramimonas_sp.AAC.1
MAGGSTEQEQVSRDQKKRARGPAWTAQSMVQAQVAKAIVDAEEQCDRPKRSRNQRFKKVLERPGEASKASVEGIKKNGGIFTALSRAGETVRVALNCAEERDATMREHALMDKEDRVALEAAEQALEEKEKELMEHGNYK